MNPLRSIWPFRRPRLDPPQADRRCFVIGDIHGELALLQKALDHAPADAQIICVGDYIDRGKQGAGVLRLLAQRPDIICLKGNHEYMLLAFVDEPDTKTEKWLRHGGLQTLSSFGVGSGAATLASEAERMALRDDLVAAMGPDLLAWVRGLPSHWITGNVAISHAGADPALPIPEQPDKNLIWGHRDFARGPRRDGLWVLHGHSVVPEARIAKGAIAIDTGAYATGRLTCAHLGQDGCSFVTVTTEPG